MNNKNINSSITDSMSIVDALLNTDRNFDIVKKTFTVAEKHACIYFIDGFTKDDVLLKILQGFSTLSPDNLPASSFEFANQYLPYGEVSLTSSCTEIVTSLLSGMSCMLIDGYSECMVIDCRTYPARSVNEPEKDKVLRGSRDGFVETLIFNTALIRRRIRDPAYSVEILTAGKRSHTDIAICYMDDLVNKALLDKIKESINNIDVDSLTMNQESLAECIYPHKWFNPFPKFRFSERPDTCAAHILEGNIVILVDNSPAAMVLPSSVFDIIEEANDYYFPPITGTYLRLSRFIITIFALYFTPLWLLLMQNTAWIPVWLDFIKIKDPVFLPLIWQLIILEFAIDGLKLAAVNTPGMLSTPLSVIAGIVLGEYSVKSGWFNSETMLYMAFITIANYSQTSYELGYAVKFLRVIILILTALFNLWGFAAGIILSICSIIFNRTIAGTSYIYPLIPFNLKKIKNRFFRQRLNSTKKTAGFM